MTCSRRMADTRHGGARALMDRPLEGKKKNAGLDATARLNNSLPRNAQDLPQQSTEVCWRKNAGALARIFFFSIIPRSILHRTGYRCPCLVALALPPRAPTSQAQAHSRTPCTLRIELHCLGVTIMAGDNQAYQDGRVAGGDAGRHRNRGRRGKFRDAQKIDRRK